MIVNGFFSIFAAKAKMKIFSEELKLLLHQKSNVSMVKASSISDSLKNKEIVTESFVPKGCLLGNINFHKEYDKAIEEGKRIEAECPNDYFVHCNMMVSYFRKGDIENCNKEAKLAIIKGHHTGYCESRLSINLYKQKKYHQVIQLSEIEENPRFGPFFDDVYKRKLQAQKNIAKAMDTEKDRLFTDEEVEELYQNIEKQRALREWFLNTRKHLRGICYSRENYRQLMLGNKEVEKEMNHYREILSELNKKYGYLE